VKALKLIFLVTACIILVIYHIRHSDRKFDNTRVAPNAPIPNKAIYRSTPVPSAIPSTTAFKNQGEAIDSDLDAKISSIEL